MATMEIILLIFALGFVVLVAFLAKFLYTACGTMRKMNRTLGAVQKTIDSFGHEPRNLIRNLNDLTEDAYFKMNALNPFFQAFSNVGESLEQRSNAFKERSHAREYERSDDYEEEINDGVRAFYDLASLGLGLWKKIKREK